MCRSFSESEPAMLTISRQYAKAAANGNSHKGLHYEAALAWKLGCAPWTSKVIELLAVMEAESQAQFL